MVNGWVLYKRYALQSNTEKKHVMSLTDFRKRVALSLLQENEISNKRRGCLRSDTPPVQKNLNQI